MTTDSWFEMPSVARELREQREALLVGTHIRRCPWNLSRAVEACAVARSVPERQTVKLLSGRAQRILIWQLAARGIPIQGFVEPLFSEEAHYPHGFLGGTRQVFNIDKVNDAGLIPTALLIDALFEAEIEAKELWGE